LAATLPLLLAVWLIIRLARRLADLVAAQRAARDLRRLGQPISEDGLCRIVPSPEPFAFAVGIFEPVVAVSPPLWDKLTFGQRQVLLAHERAHVNRRDLLVSQILWAASLFGAPTTGRTALSLWELTSELLCDREAVLAAGRPSIVADAILAVARMRKRPTALPLTAVGAHGYVMERIESLLREEPDGAPAAARLSTLGWLGVALFLFGCTVFSEPLHHLLETLLG
jgi:hypothetical protein